MKTRIGLLVAAVLTIAALAYGQEIATDQGGAIVNHSNGVVTFPYNKLLNSKSYCTANPDAGVPLCSNYFPRVVGYYTSTAEYPTSFKPTVANFDGGCQKHTLQEDAILNATGRSGNSPVFCRFDLPLSILDAGVFTFYRELDGGYGVSQCPATATIGTTSIGAFCNVQLRGLP